MTIIRRGKPAKNEARGLTKEIVLEGALALVDEVGLERFSVRTLAERLSVYPAAIRWWVPTRDALLAEVVNFSYRDVRLAEPSSEWRTWIHQFFVAHRNVIRRHPNVGPLLASQLLSNAGTDLEIVERLLAVLSLAGFRGERLFQAFDIVIVGAIGFVAMEFAAPPGDDESGFRKTMQERISALDAEEFPLITRHRDQLANRHFVLRWENGSTMPLDASFEAFVYTITEGLRLLMTR